MAKNDDYALGYMCGWKAWFRDASEHSVAVELKLALAAFNPKSKPTFKSGFAAAWDAKSKIPLMFKVVLAVL